MFKEGLDVPRSSCHGGAGSQVGLGPQRSFPGWFGSVLRGRAGAVSPRPGHGSLWARLFPRHPCHPGAGPGTLPPLSPLPAPPGWQDSGLGSPAVGGSRGGASRSLPFPCLRARGEEVPERGSIFPWPAGAGEEPPPAREEGALRATGVGRGGREGGWLPPFSVLPFPRSRRFPGRAGAVGAGLGRARPCAGPGWGCAPRGRLSQALGL